SGAVSVDATGHAAVTLPTAQIPLSVNLHAIRATYSGDVNYATSATTSNTNITVQKDNSNVAVSASPASTSLGQSVTFTATVTAALPGAGTPSGSVSFFDGVPI